MINLDLSEAANKKLRAFSMHGVKFIDDTESQGVGQCPFCNKSGHFHANKKNLLWDCKVCGESGNLFQFLEKINKRNLENIGPSDMQRLSRDKELPKSVFTSWEIGYFNGQYTFAVHNDKGTIQDLRLYRIGNKVLSTAQAKTGLFGLAELSKDDSNVVYICEGEWDTMAMQNLLDRAKAKGRAVCSPGANVFKAEWVDYFSKKKIYVCFDNDEAGIKGQKIVASRLDGLTTGISFLHWPSKYSPGYDLRDYYIEKYMPTKKPKKSLQRLLGYVRSTRVGADESEEAAVILESPEIDPTVTIEDAIKSYAHKMHAPNRDAIELCFLSVLSNIFSTRPLWYFLVAPSSAGKTEIINGFKYLCPPFDNLAHFTSNLTAHSLISGMKSSKDPSLFALFENSPKTLFIKDFTTILSAPDNEKAEIFGQLRDAHDGYSSKDFGNGVERRYRNLNFSILAGVTYQIYDEAESFAALGERFGKLILTNKTDIDSQFEMMSKSMDNIGKEQVNDDRTAVMVYSAIKNLVKHIEVNNVKLPTIPAWAKEQISAIAIYTAHMRGSVSRDRFRRELIKSKPTIEFPMRFSTMLATTAIYRALMYGRSKIDKSDLRLVRKIALDTINQRDEEIIRKAYILNNDKDQEASKRNIQSTSTYTSFTVEQVLQNFTMLDILKTEKVNRKIVYIFTDKMKRILEEAGIYQTEEELNRKGLVIPELEKKSRSGRRKLKIKKNK